MRLENKVALVTGASSGMGNEIAKLFAKEGASVVAIARRKEKLNDLVDQIEADGGKAVAVAGDVISDEDIRNAVKTAVKEFGKLDIAINNAGLSDKMDLIADVKDDMWNAVINVNMKGPMHVFRAAIPEMLKVGGGTFVTVASIAGIRGSRGGPIYTASKHGAIGLAKNVAFQYAKKNIRSNIIAPGVVTTEMLSTVGSTSNKEGIEISNSGAANNPRLGEPLEIAQLALFLASDEASLINGATVTADSGWTAY